MEKWEQDQIDRLEKRVWEIEKRERDFRFRDGMRIHLNMAYLVWGLAAALIVFEIVVAVLRHTHH